MLTNSRQRGGQYKLPNETFAEPVIHVLTQEHFAMVLEYPGNRHPTPVFHIQKQRTNEGWRWDVKSDFSIGFTENMLNRVDVIEYMVTANNFVDTTDITTIRDTVHRLLVYWTTLFPNGVPDKAFI